MKHFMQSRLALSLVMLFIMLERVQIQPLWTLKLKKHVGVTDSEFISTQHAVWRTLKTSFRYGQVLEAI